MSHVTTFHLAGAVDVLVAAHWPDGDPRRAVVVCPPFGYDHVCAQHTLRELASLVADQGDVALLYDPAGRRGSGMRGVGTDELDAWVASAVAVARHAATLATDGVVLLGVRTGSMVASLAAASVTDDGGLRSPLVLVDPTPVGKRHLRELRSLQLMGVASADLPGDPGGSSILGEPLTAATADALAAVDLGAVAPPCDHCLVVSRPGHAGADRLVEAWSSGCVVEHHHDPGLAEMFVLGAERSVVPVDTLRRVVHFVADVPMPSGHRPQPDAGRLGVSHPVVAASITAAPGAVESVVAIGGDASPVLRGVWCEPEGGRAPGGRAVLFVNNGAHAESGPACAWTRWARELAAAGMPSMRISVRGLGQSDDTGEQRVFARPSDRFYLDGFLDDIEVAVGEVRRRGAREVVLVGLCSSAMAVLDVAGHASAADLGVVGVLAISPPLDVVPAGPLRRRRVRSTRRANQRLLRWFDTTVLGEKVSRRMPVVGWRVLAALRLAATPASAPLTVARNGVAVVVLGPPEELLRWLPRSPRTTRALARHPLARTVVSHGMDHALFRDDARVEAGRLLAALVQGGLDAVDRLLADAEAVSGSAPSAEPVVQTSAEHSTEVVSGQATDSVRVLSS